jgi:hypothetical protein
MGMRVKMLETVEGAKAGDVLTFQDEAEARRLIEQGKAEPAPLKLETKEG